MAKQFFFDFDGTLAAPVFSNGLGMNIGFTDSQFALYCATHGPAAYDDCRPVKEVIEFAKQMKTEGHRCSVLTAAESFGEQWAKLVWLKRMGLFSRDDHIWQIIEDLEQRGMTSVTKDRIDAFHKDLAAARMFLDKDETMPYWKSNTDSLFDAVIFPYSMDEKVKAIQLYMSRECPAKKDLYGCALVDDHYPTLLAAHMGGIQAIHITHILTGSICR